MPVVYFEVQLQGADGNIWRNRRNDGVAFEITDPQFLRIKEGHLKRSGTKASKEFTMTLDNRGGTYNNVITKGQQVNVWIGASLDGSDRVLRFVGTCFKIENSKKHTGITLMKATFKDATFNLMNTLVTAAFVPNEVRAGGDYNETNGYLASYTLNDYAEIVKWILSFRNNNPVPTISVSGNYVLTTGSTIRQNKNYDHARTLDILNELATECNHIFYIDTAGQAHFEPKNLPSTIPTTSIPLIRNLSERTDFNLINELSDSTQEKNRILMYCGATIDGNRIVEVHEVADASRQTKSIFRRNINIAPNVAGGDAATRSANARAACNEAARLEYEMLKTMHEFRLGDVFTYRDTDIGDLYTITWVDGGYNPSSTLKLIEIEETFKENLPYTANYVLSTNLT